MTGQGELQKFKESYRKLWIIKESLENFREVEKGIRKIKRFVWKTNRTETFCTEDISYRDKSYGLITYLIFVIFLHTRNFGYFFSTQKRLNRNKTNLRQKCVNCNKTNFTTKKHEFYTCGGILHITHMPDVEKFQICPHLSYSKI